MKLIPICSREEAPPPQFWGAGNPIPPRKLGILPSEGRDSHSYGRVRFLLRFPRIGAGGLLLFLLLAALPVAAAPDLPNFHSVAPGIWRGAAPTEAGLRQLKAMGVKTVIDLRIAPKTVQKEGLYARSLGFHWINLPMGADPPTPKQVATLLATLQRAPAEPVFVHCQHGADRTGCMIGIYRVTKQHWAFSQAWTEMRKDGFDPRWGKLKAAVEQRAVK